MAVEFSEHRCKKKYKPKRQNIPVFRVLILIFAVFFAFKLGFVDKIIQALPLPEKDEPVAQLTWEDLCANYGGTGFALKNGLVQCSWVVRDTLKILPSPFLRYLMTQKNAGVQKIHWVAMDGSFEKPLLVQYEDSLVYTYLNVMLEDSSYVWIDAKSGCRFPGLCPSLPLDWSNIVISESFDFEGQDRLLAEDAFLGPGEAPVHPVLAGVVLDVGRDSLGPFVEFSHGNNVVSRMSGVNTSLAPGDTVDVNSVVGRLPPRDSAEFFLTVRRNGHFVRWADFYKDAHPVSDGEIAKFKSQIGI